MKRIGEVLTSFPLPPAPVNRPTPPPEPTWRCPVCHDAGWVRMQVPIGHPNFGKLFPCACRVDDDTERARNRLHRLSNLQAFTHHTFDDFEVLPGTEDAFAAAREFAHHPEGWLYLHGGVGTGKTHLAVAAALEVQKRNSTAFFAVVPDLLDHLRATFDPKGGTAYDERFNDIRNSFLLVLDDLGTENTTPWAREKLYQIVNHRYVERLPTIITSNRKHEDIDERIRSRLLDSRVGYTRDVQLTAEDFRMRGRSDYTRGRRPR